MGAEVGPNRARRGHRENRAAVKLDRQIEYQLAERRFGQVRKAGLGSKLAQRFDRRVVNRRAGVPT